MALEVPQFSVDARFFMVVSYLETLNFVLYHHLMSKADMQN